MQTDEEKRRRAGRVKHAVSLLQTDASGLGAMLRARSVRGCDDRAVRRMLAGDGLVYDDVLAAVETLIAEGGQGPAPKGAAPVSSRPVVDLTGGGRKE